MKKLLILFIIVISCFFSFQIGDLLAEKAEEQAIINSINDDKYTDEEFSKFQNQLNTKTYHYYNSLSDSQKEAYMTLYFSALNFDESCKVQIPNGELETIIFAIIYDNSDIFWLSGNYTYYEYETYIELIPEYSFSKSDADAITADLKVKIQEIISQLPFNASEYETELFLHDYICNNTEYDESKYKNGGDTPQSALIEGKSICEGYARAMQMLLDAVGIDNYLIVGDGTSEGVTEPHMWNIVNIDGYNYHLDVTWNDGVTHEDLGGYFYFNVTDSYILRDHSNLEPSINNCSYNYANYFVVQNTYITTFTGFENLVNSTANVLKTGNNTVEFLFENESDYKLALKQMDNNYRFFGYIENSIKTSGRQLAYDNIEYYTSDEYYYLCIVFKEE